jgi:hypothetical protein
MAASFAPQVAMVEAVEERKAEEEMEMAAEAITAAMAAPVHQATTWHFV